MTRMQNRPSEKIVRVIASYDEDGHIKPLYIEFQHAAEKIVDCEIRKYYTNVAEFLYKRNIREVQHSYILRYYIYEMSWTLEEI